MKNAKNKKNTKASQKSIKLVIESFGYVTVEVFGVEGQILAHLNINLEKLPNTSEHKANMFDITYANGEFDIQVPLNRTLDPFNKEEVTDLVWDVVRVHFPVFDHFTYTLGSGELFEALGDLIGMKRPEELDKPEALQDDLPKGLIH